MSQTEWANIVRCYVFDYDLLDDFRLHLAGNDDNRITLYVDGGLEIFTTTPCEDFDLRAVSAMLRSSYGEGRFVVEVPPLRQLSLVQLRINPHVFIDWLRDSQLPMNEQLLDELHVLDGRAVFHSKWDFHGLR